MPEYLAPGVYLEEIDTGSKPIEGVSTSTCGLVGVTERGPVNVPVLVTSVGEFVRWYGGLLRSDDYGTHRFLPHAIEGFFTNGGKRAYVVRVLELAASRAAGALFHARTSVPLPLPSMLVRPAGEGTGTTAQLPMLVVLPDSGLVAGDWVRVGDGSDAEYHQIDSAPTAETVLVPLALPLARSHQQANPALPLDELTRTVVATPYAIAGAVTRGSTQIVVKGAHADITALVAGACLEIGAQAVAEYRFITDATNVTAVDATDSTVRLHLDAALTLARADTTVVTLLDLSGAPVATATVELATAGAGLVFVQDRGGNFATRGNLVRIGPAATQELRPVGTFSRFVVTPATSSIESGTLVEAMQVAADRSITNNPANAGVTDLVLQAGETVGLVPGEQLILDPTGTAETVTVLSVDAASDTITVAPPLTSAHNQNSTVVPLARTTNAAATAGGRVLSVADRTGIDDGAVLRVGSGIAAQLVTVESVPAVTGVAPDAGNVVVSPPLNANLPNGSTVELVRFTPVPGRQATIVALPAAAGTDTLWITDGDSFAVGEIIRLTDAAGKAGYYQLTDVDPKQADMITVALPALARAHPAGSMVVQRTALIDVQALDAGIWGNRLRISVENESPGLVSNTTLATAVNATTIRLASAAGVQPGTILEFTDPATGAPRGDPVKVNNVNRSAQNTITLAAPGLQAAQVVGSAVSSREFRITVRLLRQPDPSVPSRNNQVIDLETFRNLSLDPRHSNFVETVIGAIAGPLRKWDRRPEGGSLYIRVRDLGNGDQVTQHSVRLGPEALVDVLPDGRTVPAQLRLETTLGDDAVATIGDSTYVGADNVDPELRTGLQSLRNVEDISIVALPGRVSVTVQQAAIDHCELMRYRFAVLDSLPEPTDTIRDAQGQRQQFDTKYAALYYPWLSIPDPFPTNLTDVPDYPIPPAGHLLGVYARTDIERGVHKAPANEVVRGITGLRRKVNKEQQDILNPYPVNINVIRDFRDHNRGIRVYGGRVITSDPDWKYVNVRRLMIFIEASLERGLQWVVFEPNADPLWARVRRVVSNFLTTVWRNGALEGAKVEEAFFVKCDRTTMTQTDIDNGRLIVVVGVAPVKPAEFVIVRIGLWTAHADS